MTDRCVWVYREMRSGGSWLCNFLSKNLHKKHIFLEHHSHLVHNIKPNDLHVKYIFSTHEVDYMKPVKDYINPIVIHCSRRDRFEQMLSEFFMSATNQTVSNIHDTSDLDRFTTISNIKITHVTKDIVLRWKEKQSNETNKWQSFSHELNVHTIYYEDFFAGAKIDDIDLVLKFDDETTKKLPSYKQSVFVNYEEIKDWFYSI